MDSVPDMLRPDADRPIAEQVHNWLKSAESINPGWPGRPTTKTYWLMCDVYEALAGTEWDYEVPESYEADSTE